MIFRSSHLRESGWGKNFETGGTYDEISGAYYTGFDGIKSEFITIPNPEKGDYLILTRGTGPGAFRIEATRIKEDESGGAEDPVATFRGEASLGSESSFSMTLSDVGASIGNVVEVRTFEVEPPAVVSDDKSDSKKKKKKQTKEVTSPTAAVPAARSGNMEISGKLVPDPDDRTEHWKHDPLKDGSSSSEVAGESDAAETGAFPKLFLGLGLVPVLVAVGWLGYRVSVKRRKKL